MHCHLFSGINRFWLVFSNSHSSPSFLVLFLPCHVTVHYVYVHFIMLFELVFVISFQFCVWKRGILVINVHVKCLVLLKWLGSACRPENKNRQKSTLSAKLIVFVLKIWLCSDKFYSVTCVSKKNKNVSSYMWQGKHCESSLGDLQLLCGLFRLDAIDSWQKGKKVLNWTPNIDIGNRGCTKRH